MSELDDSMNKFKLELVAMVGGFLREKDVEIQSFESQLTAERELSGALREALVRVEKRSQDRDMAGYVINDIFNIVTKALSGKGEG